MRLASGFHALLVDLILALAGTVAVCAALAPFLPYQPRTTIRSAVHDIHKFGAALTPDGKTIIIADGHAVHFLETATGRERFTWNGTPRFLPISPDGKTCALAGDNEVVFVDLDEFLVRSRFSGKISDAFWYSFLSDRRLLVYARSQVLVIDSSTGSVRLQAPSTDYSASPDGTTLALFMTSEKGKGSGIVQLWDTETGALRATLSGEEFDERTSVFSLDGNILATVNRATQTIVLWDVRTGRKRLTLPGGPGAPVFSPDGRSLVAAPARDVRGTRVWDIASGEPRATLPVDGREHIEFSADARLLVTGSADDGLTIWDTATWQRRAGIAPAGIYTNIQNWMVTPDSKSVVTWSVDDLPGTGRINLHDATDGQERASFRFSQPVLSLIMQASNHGTMLFIAEPEPSTRPSFWQRFWPIAAFPDKSEVKLIDVAAAKELATLRQPVQLYQLSGDGRTFFIDNQEGLGRTICIWDVRPRRATEWLLAAPALLTALTLGAWVLRRARSRSPEPK